MCSGGFLPHVTVPTRFATNSCSLLDQIYIKTPREHDDIHNIKTSSGVMISNISDHLPCFTSICITLIKTTKNSKCITLNNLSETAISKFKEGLAESRLQDMLNNNLNVNPNLTYDIIDKQIADARETFLPVKTVRFNKHKHTQKSWMTVDILRAIKYRDRLYKTYLSKPINSTEKASYKTNLGTCKFFLKKDIKEAKQTYYCNEFKQYKKDIRKTWDTIKSILNHPVNKSTAPKHILVNNKKIRDEREIADYFNNYFTHIRLYITSKIDTNAKYPFQHYLRTPTISKFNLQNTNADEILSVINKLPTKTSSGHDHISCKILKEIKDIISEPLALLTNQVFNTSIFPAKLKLAKVIPLYKKGDIFSIENYRPISLLSSFSKVLEKNIFNQLFNFFQCNNLFYNSQYGFRKDHSTEFAALELIDIIKKELDAKHDPFAVFLDLSKAFDTIDHTILLKKLSYYGIQHKSLNLFENYLSERYQYVSVGNATSTHCKIHTGVPQGSIIGPLLFIIYIKNFF